MGIGGSIFLIAVGAILTFGLNVRVGWLDFDVVGVVLMLAGVLGLILTTWFWQSRRRQTVTTAPVETRAPVDTTRRRVEERTEVVGPPDPL